MYVADDSTCGRAGVMRDEASSSADGTLGRWIARASAGDETCDVDDRALTLGASGELEEAVENASAMDGAALADALRGSSTIEARFRSLERGERDPSVGLLRVFSIEDVDRGSTIVALLVGGRGTAMLDFDAAAPKSFALVETQENATSVLIVTDEDTVRLYLNGDIALEFARGIILRPLNQDMQVRIRLGGKLHNFEDFWCGSFYHFIVYPFAMNTDDIKQFYAARETEYSSTSRSGTDEVTLNFGGTLDIAFGVVTQIELDADKLDEMCDKNNSACSLTKQSDLIVRELPLFGVLLVCETQNEVRIGEKMNVDSLCYAARRVLNHIEGVSLKYMDHFTFTVADDSLSPRFRVEIDVHEGILACNTTLRMMEDTMVIVTLQLIDTANASDDMRFEILTVPDRISLYFEDGRTVPVGERFLGHHCGSRPPVQEFTIDEGTKRACLDIVLIPDRDYFNFLESFVGPEFPPWPMEAAIVSYMGISGARLSQRASLRIMVNGKTDAIELRVNQTVFHSQYLQWVAVGKFELRASDFDARALKVTIRSARGNILAITNQSALELCENPFVAGDGSGNAEITFHAAPSVISDVLNSLIYIHLKRGVTSDELLIQVSESRVVLIAFLQE